MNKTDYKRLGDYIREVDTRNRDLAVTRLLGVSISKEFMPSIANTIGTDMSSYKIVTREQFAYGPVTSRNGDKVSIALLTDDVPAIISQAYTVFEITDKNLLLPAYLMMWFRRPEFDRYARYHSHGSAREVFDWEAMCDVRLPIPPISRQREIVAEYETLTSRIRLNERLISSLESAAQTLYRRTFVDNPNPSWRTGTIGEFCKIFTGKKDVNESLPLGKYRFFSCAPGYFYSDEYISKGPAVLIAGNGSYTGRVSFYDKEFDLYQRTYACVMRENYESLIYSIYAILKFSFEKKSGGSRGTSIPYIVRGDIENFTFPYEKGVFCKFSREMKSFIAYLSQLAETTKKLEEMKNLSLSSMGN